MSTCAVQSGSLRLIASLRSHTHLKLSVRNQSPKRNQGNAQCCCKLVAAVARNLQAQCAVFVGRLLWLSLLGLSSVHRASSPEWILHQATESVQASGLGCLAVMCHPCSGGEAFLFPERGHAGLVRRCPVKRKCEMPPYRRGPSFRCTMKYM